MTHLTIITNGFGTPVDVYRCDTCGDEFTVCPANEDRSRDEQWTGCMAPRCASYDPTRDVDRLFDDGDVFSFERRMTPNLIQRRTL